ncbi:hypothetical protein HN018_02930 [Lichenicola cladoniae]|uniref:Uncharacterized protein n=1 Tax=Lichenicola cladoniae TaxID=1484109 RepID=A0A6M8HLC0_9PROT|nr:hypothetical protein [Lichenicola cladoniae]NPD68911.1 hypothetical protein [Acetobacteraceae bacterium]QKE89142.1 hypothetical protein HN018_02930 [Lichenicola cladoniae]
MTGPVLVPLLPVEIRALVLWHRLEARGRGELGTGVHMRRVDELQALLDGRPG